MYLIFSFAHPDYWIARYNLSHVVTADTNVEDDSYRSSRAYSDFYYLRNLSMDAAPAIYGMVNELEYNLETTSNLQWFNRYSAKIVRKSWDGNPDSCLPQKQSIREFNFSRWIAYKSYTKYYNEHKDFQKNIVSDIYNL